LSASISAVQRLLGAIGARLIRVWITLFGRRVRKDSVPWLLGPIGPGGPIGERPYGLVAAQDQLTIDRTAASAGLVPDFGVLANAAFDPALVHPEVRRFYEHTADYDLEAWSESPFPGRLFLWLIVSTVSRSMNQLNFPVSGLELSRGMASEILPMKDASGRTVHTGWLRRAKDTGRVIYTGFYTVGCVPLYDGGCVKVVFPLPRGNATVLFRPGVERQSEVAERGRGCFTLASEGGGDFGDTGFYRVLESGPEHWRVLRFRTLHEHFWVFVDPHGVLRCDHRVRLFGMTMLRLHYKMTRKTPPGPPAVAAPRA
jgi:hypothetical protein